MALLVDEGKLRRLMEDILHGDAEHQRWLKEKIEEIIEKCKEIP